MDSFLRRGATLATSLNVSAFPSLRASRTAAASWICNDCITKSRTRFASRTSVSGLEPGRRWLSISAQTLQEQGNSSHILQADASALSKASNPTASSGPLPSQTAEKRWKLSKRMTKLVDGILARASIYSQHINAYTGTDYSGIDALRKEIIQQETKVRAFHSVVEQAKKDYEQEFAKQGASQKEIVTLLERKSQWSPGDLERYMALVRTEHVHEQALQTAKNHMEFKERELEAARGLLEKLERKQYHEEQIWSDTIRRNSTWVTFGLMGVNIILLLAQILVFEPYRRKKIVQDMKEALDEKTIKAPLTELERQVDVVVPPPGPVQKLEVANAEPTPIGLVSMIDSDAPQFVADPVASAAPPVSIEPDGWMSWREAWLKPQEVVQAVFSERAVSMRQVDVTKIALQSVATGALAAAGVAFMILRQR